MKVQSIFSPVRPILRIAHFFLLGGLALTLAACISTGKSGSEPKPPANPNEHRFAYGASVVLPASWKIAGSTAPESVSKASLDQRRQNGERILIFEATGPASPRGLESMIGVFLVHQDGTFMPRDYAEKLQPDEFTAMSRDLLEREKRAANKKKAQSGLLDLQVLREDINGNLSISQRMLVAGPDGKPVRLMNWDIYLPDGAGIAVKTVCDPETPGVENEVINLVRSLRVQ